MYNKIACILSNFGFSKGSKIPTTRPHSCRITQSASRFFFLAPPPPPLTPDPQGLALSVHFWGSVSSIYQYFFVIGLWVFSISSRFGALTATACHANRDHEARLTADPFKVLSGTVYCTIAGFFSYHNWKRFISNEKLVTCMNYSSSNTNYSCGFWKPDVYKTTTKTHNCIFITMIINNADDIQISHISFLVVGATWPLPSADP